MAKPIIKVLPHSDLPPIVVPLTELEFQAS